MAILPELALAVRAPNIAPAINIFENALMNAQTRDIRAQQAQRAQALAPFQLQQAQQNVDINQQALDAGQIEQELQAENRIIRSVAEFGTRLKPALESGNTDQALTMLTERFTDLQSQGLPTNETVEAITAIRNGDSQGVVSSINAAQDIARQRGLTGASLLSVGQRDFNSNVAAVKADPKLETVEGRAASVALGLTAKASLTKDERVANDKALGKRVAEQKGAEAEATEGGKLTQQLKRLPEIRRQIKLAEKAATEQGEVLTDLARAEAGLPGLIEATNSLKELAAVATSTFGGRLFDTIAKESGWGSTKGANARAKYIAIIDNQVLPLLKQTFGAAMTEGEGLRLSNTLGDANASPEQKVLQTEAFIEQKLRDIERLKSQAGVASTESANNADVPEVDISTLSIEDLIAERNRLGGQ